MSSHETNFMFGVLQVSSPCTLVTWSRRLLSVTLHEQLCICPYCKGQVLLLKCCISCYFGLFYARMTYIVDNREVVSLKQNPKIDIRWLY